MEVGDEQKSEEIAKKLSQCWYGSWTFVPSLFSYMEVGDEQKPEEMPKNT